MGNMKRDDKKELINYLKSQNLMTLATYDKEPWVCSVYYAIDKDLNLYFVSSPDSGHSKDIEKNSNVACAIADSHTLNSAKKVGVQMQGVASIVKGWERTQILLKMWHRAAPGVEEMINVANMKNKVVSSRVYKVKPTRIKFFNQFLYKKPSNRVFTFKG